MKHMKKSMFITTLAMVVVLVVALSTATFAWYSANTNVGVQKTNVLSASSNTASLVIDAAPAATVDANNSSVSLTLSGQNFPMVYTAAAGPEVDVTTYAAFSAQASFRTFTVQNDPSKFSTLPSNVAPGTINTVTGTSSSSVIVLTNVGGNTIDTLQTTITIDPHYVYTKVANPVVGEIGTYYELSNGIGTLTEDVEIDGEKTYYTRGDAHNYLRVAVFAGTTNNDAQLTLKGIYGAGTAYRANPETMAAAITGSSVATAIGASTLSLTASDSAIDIAEDVAAFGTTGNAVYVKLVIWFEGSNMANQDANRAAAFSMSFSAVND